MLLANSFDNFMIIFDSSNGNYWPLITSIVVALDLTISLDDFLQIAKSIGQSMIFDQDSDNYNNINRRCPILGSSIHNDELTQTIGAEP